MQSSQLIKQSTFTASLCRVECLQKTVAEDLGLIPFVTTNEILARTTDVRGFSHQLPGKLTLDAERPHVSGGRLEVWI